MNKKWTVLMLGAACGTAMFAINATAGSEPTADEVKIAAFMQEMKSMTPTRLNDLDPIPVRQFELPGSGIDVMRARLEETYSVDGVGTDTVELTGWIAVKHDNARPAKGETELNWNTAVVDTEFVAMDLTGTSEVFGPVHVTLDRSRPSRGQVGRIEIPELAKAALLARLDTTEREKSVKGAKAPKAGMKAAPKAKATDKATVAPTGEKAAPTTTTTRDAEADTMICSAPVVASVNMPDLDLKMVTKNHVYWYSLVDTIPPVGHTASIAIDPVRLVQNGREVGTLESGRVTFREVVRHVALTDSTERIAKKK